MSCIGWFKWIVPWKLSTLSVKVNLRCYLCWTSQCKLKSISVPEELPPPPPPYSVVDEEEAVPEEAPPPPPPASSPPPMTDEELPKGGDEEDGATAKKAKKKKKKHKKEKRHEQFLETIDEANGQQQGRYSGMMSFPLFNY